MKIITYNTQHGRTIGLLNSLKALFEIQADFYTMQEADLKVRNIINEIFDFEEYSIVFGNHKSYPGKDSKTIIVYKNNYKLLDLHQLSFFSKIGKNSYGTTLGLFEDKFTGDKIQVSSTHQIAPHFPYVRRKQTLQSLALFDNKIPGLLAGDFNTGFPLEVKDLNKLLSFNGIIHLSQNIGGTCDWSMLEKRLLTILPRLINKISAQNLPLDHICVNNEFNSIYSLKEIKVLKNIKGSDHLPIYGEFFKN